MLGLKPIAEVPDEMAFYRFNVDSGVDSAGNIVMDYFKPLTLADMRPRGERPLLSQEDRAMRMGFVIVSPEPVSDAQLEQTGQWAKFFGNQSRTINRGWSLPRNWIMATDGLSSMATQLCPE